MAIVTGAARGIGAAQARALACAGAFVAISDVLAARGESLAAEIKAAGGQAMYRDLDVAVESDWVRAVAAVVHEAGRLDILINNAGINDRQTIMETSSASWHSVMSVNLDGAFFGMRAVAPIMRDSGGGSIVNIASSAGMTGNAFAAYGTSKWALRGLSRCAALEFAPWKIRVNTICPGLVRTELNADQPYLEPVADATPLGRAGTAEEIAQLARFLASDESSYITGQDLVIDGGFTTGVGPPREAFTGRS